MSIVVRWQKFFFFRELQQNKNFFSPGSPKTKEPKKTRWYLSNHLLSSLDVELTQLTLEKGEVVDFFFRDTVCSGAKSSLRKIEHTSTYLWGIFARVSPTFPSTVLLFLSQEIKHLQRPQPNIPTLDPVATNLYLSKSATEIFNLIHWAHPRRKFIVPHQYTK